MPVKTKPDTIDKYIRTKPDEAQKKLRELLEVLRKIAPCAKEEIKWGVPALSYERILFTFAAYKDHINFYPTPSVLNQLQGELTGFRTTKSSLQLPYDEPLPITLIKKIAKLRVYECKELGKRWM